ncbi:hypothetical protein GWI33_008319 [Rhynchophorus ferrugineus]|uniref:C2H2-type domain-containing protein n=1 Tax=Rhynchophorus ferrugineus TaxID=354439 RepID=A0A834MK08_RHYFE|nr:hypothetical protein GWI33_008319 [Rhynchophorus ferrugineus]
MNKKKLTSACAWLVENKCHLKEIITIVIRPELNEKSEDVNISKELSFQRGSSIDDTETSCDVCGKLFSSEIQYFVHLKQHKKFTCDVCGKIFASNTVLKRHQISHREDRPLMCPLCPKTFKHRRVLDYHMKTLHQPSSKVYCDLCGKEFTTIKNCLRHKKTHFIEDETLTCRECNKVFANNWYLKKHMDSRHYGKVHICDICGARIADKGNLKNHMKLHDPNYKKPEPQTCPICNKTFSNIKAHHKAAHENDGKNFSCEYCGKFFQHKSGLKFHLMVHKEDKPFKCNFCEKSFILNTFLQQHLRTHPESDVKPFQCCYCDKTFIKRSNVRGFVSKCKIRRPKAKGTQYINGVCPARIFAKVQVTGAVSVEYVETHVGHEDDVHFKRNDISLVPKQESKSVRYTCASNKDERLVKCPQCPRTFRQNYKLKSHLTCHQMDKSLTCSVCQKQFKKISALNRHMRDIHEGTHKFNCEECGRVFNNKNNYNVHKKRHFQEYVEHCDYCNVGFVTKAEYRRHLQRKHAGKKFVCDTCGRSVSSERQLREHQKIHEENYEDTYFKECGVCKKKFRHLKKHLREFHEGNGKNYICDLCGKEFRGQSGLKVHLMIHRGDKPHQCSLCQKKFYSRQYLTIHLRTHSGEKPFKCEVCGKGFAQTPPLKVHMRTHSGERPYKCDLCSLNLISRQLLNFHRRSVHKIVDKI